MHLNASAFFCMVALFTNAHLTAKSYVYLERIVGNDSDVVTRTITVTSSAVGYFVNSETPTEKIACEVTEEFSIRKMHYIDKSSETSITLAQEGSRVNIAGFSGKGLVAQQIPVNPDASWQQEWIAGVNNFSLSAQPERKIFALRLEGNFRYGEFIAAKLPDEILQQNNVAIPVRRVVIKLAGVVGRIVNVDTHFWIRKNDGVVLKTTMPKGPGKPLTITELIQVRD